MKSNRKTMQLCHQVAETLNYVLAGECHDETLQGLHVLAVEPAPDATQLLVTLAPVLSDEPCDVADVLTRLTRIAGWLRAEVASSVTRKRVPQLLFRIAR